jgi:predicted acetyltransferase
MNPSPPSPPPSVVLSPIGEPDVPVLRNLFELYAHDFSEYVPLELNAVGRFDVKLDDRWWTAADHQAYLVRSGDKLAGFALVRRGSRVTSDPDVMDVGEFFIVRGARRRGVGREAACALFAAFPGPWEARVRRTNAPARAFWLRAAAAWNESSVTCSAFSVEGVEWEVIRVGARAL